jgi:hypothetical protein
MRTLLVSLVGMALAAALGCDSRDPSGPRAPGPGPRRVESNGGSYVVTYETVPDPIPLNQPFRLKLDVRPRNPGTAGTPELGVEVDARMPAHFHGMTRTPKVVRGADGSFVADGMLFHMPGRWEIYVDISQGAGVERAQWDVILK